MKIQPSKRAGAGSSIGAVPGGHHDTGHDLHSEMKGDGRQEVGEQGYDTGKPIRRVVCSSLLSCIRD